MKRTKYLITAIISLFVVIACVDEPDVYQFPTDKYYYDIPDVPVTEDYVIGVPYNIVDSGYWFNESRNEEELYTGNPKLGEYTARKPNSREPSNVLHEHLKWGKEAGIDFFMVSWGGRGWNDTLLIEWERLYNLDNQYPRIVIRYDPGYLLNRNAIRDMPETNDTLQLDIPRMDTLRMDFDSIYTHVMSKSFAYKDKKGNPVMAFCNFTNKYPGEILDLSKFINEYRTIADNKLWIMGEVGGNWSSPENWGYRDATTKGIARADTISHFDAVYITDIATGDYERWSGYYSFMDYNYNYWQQRMRPINKEYIPIIFPAFDNKVRDPSNNNYHIARWYPESKGNKPYIVSAAGEYHEDGEDVQYNLSNIKENPYKMLANVAKRNVGDSRIILVYHWNDFRNGNNLEPTREINEDYLMYTRKFFKK